MKAFFTLSLLILLTLPQPARSQSVTTDTFSVALAVNSFSLIHNFPKNFIDWDVNERGVNYIISGFLYPGNYFDEHCPVLQNCGIIVDTIFDTNGDILSFITKPEDSTIVIGDWDCRSFIVGGNNMGVVEGEQTIGEIACQTFNFYPHPLSPCPEGCYVVTEGFLDNTNPDGEKGSRGKRSLAGGTNEFKSIRGDLNWVYLPEVDTVPGFGINTTQFSNATFQFEYAFLPQEDDDELPLDVSVKRQSLIVDGPVDSLTGLPVFGAVVTLEGIIYQGGTLATNGLNSGINVSGTAEWDSIGTWTMRGTWATKDHDLDEGIFMVNKQTFDFKHPTLGQLQIMTDNEGDATTNVPIKQVVLGATGALFGHTGESTQTIIGQNASGGWNLSYTIETGGLLTGTEEVPIIIPALSIELYPNPVTNYITVALDRISDFGAYGIEIVDASGRQVLSRTFELHAGNFIWNFETSGFADGWYGLVVRKDGQVVGSKGFSKVK